MKRPPLRRWVHLLAALAAAGLALRLVPWEFGARLFPSLSPLLSLGGALAARTFWPSALLAMPVLGLALFRKRWFCFHLCPAGLCAEAAGKLHPAAAGRFGSWPRLGGWLALAILGAAAAGFPLGLFLDPLSLFNGFMSGWQAPSEWSAAGLKALFLAGLSPLASGFLLVLLVSLLRPHLWCLRLCPLGGLQDALHEAAGRLRASGSGGEARPGRRLFLGLAAGGAAGLLLKRTATAAAPVIRPPGAAPESAFKALCARCGACIRACPQGILKPDTGEAGLAGLLAPRVEYGNGYCSEQCRACTGVCPTGAIRALSLPDKQRRVIGTAEVARRHCLGWKDGLYCMTCRELCPYMAIRAEERNGIDCPVVEPAVCRGCGACEGACPSRPGAIRVRPVSQRTLEPDR